jgi:hypothetical protein
MRPAHPALALRRAEQLSLLNAARPWEEKEQLMFNILHIVEK